MAGKENYPNGTPFVNESSESLLFAENDESDIPAKIQPLVPLIATIPNPALRLVIDEFINEFPKTTFPIARNEAVDLLFQTESGDKSHYEMYSFMQSLHEQGILPFQKTKVKNKTLNLIGEKTLVAFAAITSFKAQRRAQSSKRITYGELDGQFRAALGHDFYEQLYTIETSEQKSDSF